jgi:hypothetical protein
MGFDYRSSRFDENLGIVGVEDDDLDLSEGYDGLTNQVTVSDSVKFAAYVGPPSFEGTYVGFAPTDEEEEA